jgi:predicted dehydrogenase
VIPERYKVTEETSFSGFEAYRHVIESDVDLVLIASPPGFHPLHLRAAVEADKHVFLEKPAGVDPAGIASVVASGQLADEKNLSIVTGTIYRRQPNFVDAVAHIHEGAIGQLLGSVANYLTGPIWLRERKPGMSDMEWQCRNWYYFDWLSGDHIVEQFVHNLDVHHWVYQDLPDRALATGGRQQRVDPSFGHIYDHFSIDFEFANGAHLHATCRQMENAARVTSNRFFGTEGVADLNPTSSVIKSHDGEVIYQADKGEVNPYETEHTDLIASIREGEPINEVEDLTGSTMMGILGRESAYTGQHLTMEELRSSKLDIVPKTFAFGDMPVPPVPTPGVTSLNRSSPDRMGATTATSQ